MNKIMKKNYQVPQSMIVTLLTKNSTMQVASPQGGGYTPISNVDTE